MYKVVLVDDEPIIVEGLSRSVEWEKWNCKVVATAHDGLEGRKIIEDVNPDIVFMDICMPEMNGLDLVKKVRAEQKYADMPIIMVTTEGGKAEVITALKAGVNNYIVKPFTPQVLKEKLEDVLGTAQAQ